MPPRAIQFQPDNMVVFIKRSDLSEAPLDRRRSQSISGNYRNHWSPARGKENNSGIKTENDRNGVNPVQWVFNGSIHPASDIIITVEVNDHPQTDAGHQPALDGACIARSWMAVRNYQVGAILGSDQLAPSDPAFNSVSASGLRTHQRRVDVRIRRPFC